ncbi:hypothetical protein [Glaciibacter sp. 2TAF33]
MSEHADGKPDRAAQAPEDPNTGQASSGQEHHNPETEEDTASGGAPDE